VSCQRHISGSLIHCDWRTSTVCPGLRLGECGTVVSITNHQHIVNRRGSDLDPRMSPIDADDHTASQIGVCSRCQERMYGPHRGENRNEDRWDGLGAPPGPRRGRSPPGSEDTEGARVWLTVVLVRRGARIHPRPGGRQERRDESLVAARFLAPPSAPWRPLHAPFVSLCLGGRRSSSVPENAPRPRCGSTLLSPVMSKAPSRLTRPIRRFRG
jgi:hypothetical protein